MIKFVTSSRDTHTHRAKGRLLLESRRVSGQVSPRAGRHQVLRASLRRLGAWAGASLPEEGEAIPVSRFAEHRRSRGYIRCIRGRSWTSEFAASGDLGRVLRKRRASRGGAAQVLWKAAGAGETCDWWMGLCFQVWSLILWDFVAAFCFRLLFSFRECWLWLYNGCGETSEL